MKLSRDACVVEKIIFRYYTLLYMRETNVAISHRSFHEVLRDMWANFRVPHELKKSLQLEQIFARSSVRCLVNGIYYARTKIDSLSESLKSQKFQELIWNTVLMEFRRRQICVAAVYLLQ
eukprot:Gregarina_sp_Poly_1__5117@NODE_2709_length_1797_cov_47_712139_g1718_i0_p3_GENE_NODE_2709_length_1797_cov_47_712139_g1718_i0NODE_2709_length_1797_cov_47_712139_g1718_i0_p3_ORF_typecomplete_len120_score8_85GatB_Yqey/PF02637_18/0_092_NODE_2709_length_1797_cov_47_712139_g1718_i0133492